MTINITRIDPTAFAPLYERYPREINPQPAFLELDEDGGVHLGVAPERMAPMEVWHHRVHRWIVPATLSAAQCNDLLDRAAPLLERIHAGHTLVWDGRNYVGKLNGDAVEADADLRSLCESIEGELIPLDTSDWLGSDPEPLKVTADMDDAAIRAQAQDLVANARGDGAILDEDHAIGHLRWLRDELRQAAAEDA